MTTQLPFYRMFSEKLLVLNLVKVRPYLKQNNSQLLQLIIPFWILKSKECSLSNSQEYIFKGDRKTVQIFRFDIGAKKTELKIIESSLLSLEFWEALEHNLRGKLKAFSFANLLPTL